MAADRDRPALADALRAALGPAGVRAEEPLARYTAFRIGGPADLLVAAQSVDTLRQAVTMAWQQDVPCRVLGGGSNVLVSDAGARGLVVLNRTKGLTFGERTVKAESGASFSTLARQCVARGLAGLEWAVGIPGTVGGAVVGNAGAWGGDVASSLSQATVLTPGGGAEAWPVERFRYGYRTSILKRAGTGKPFDYAQDRPFDYAQDRPFDYAQDKPFDYAQDRQQAVVLDAEFGLAPGDREALAARTAEITARRKATQPPGATCGSVFKNPAGDYAGRLVEAAGLKGRRIGGAEISTVHANFIVNRGDATAADVQALIRLARREVQARFGVTLELEIEFFGDWQEWE